MAEWRDAAVPLCISGVGRPYISRQGPAGPECLLAPHGPPDAHDIAIVNVTTKTRNCAAILSLKIGSTATRVVVVCSVALSLLQFWINIY